MQGVTALDEESAQGQERVPVRLLPRNSCSTSRHSVERTARRTCSRVMVADAPSEISRIMTEVIFGFACMLPRPHPAPR